MKNNLDFGTRFSKQIGLLKELNCKPANLMLDILSIVPSIVVKEIQDLTDERFSSLEEQFRYKKQIVLVRAYAINGKDQLNVEIGSLFVNLSNFDNSLGSGNMFANLSTPDKNEYHFKAQKTQNPNEFTVLGIYFENGHKIEPKWTVTLSQLSDAEQLVK